MKTIFVITLAVALTLAVCPLHAVTYTFSVFAGSPDLSGTTDGTGTAARFSSPNALVSDSSGNLYVSGLGTTTLRKITPAGVVTTVADFSGSSRYPGIVSLAVDSAGNLYLGDAGNYIIRKLTPAGILSTFAGSGTYGSLDGSATVAQFTSPNALACDSAGNVFVAETFSIRKITPAGDVSTLAGSANSSGAAAATDATGPAARFNGISGLTIDRADNLYAADKLNHSIRKISSAGVVTTFAGRAGYAGSADGTGADAHFFLPGSLGIDAAGNIFVADTGYHTLRQITPAGVVTTIA